jgi:hypothetical protein
MATQASRRPAIARGMRGADQSIHFIHFWGPSVMLTLRRSSALASFLALGALGVTPLGSRAQVIRPGFPFQVGVNLNQAAFNQGMTGFIQPNIPFQTPSSFPFANVFAARLNPNAAFNPNTAINFFNPNLSSAFAQQNAANVGAVGQAILNQAQFTGLANSLANPYLAAVNPYLGGASLSTSPYSGYDNSSAYGGYGYYESPIGGYMRGTADIMSAQGRWFKDVQQALQMKEKFKQEQIATRRQKLDEYLYEREKAPTPEDERQRAVQLQITRSLNNPPLGEILSGQAPNNVLADIRRNEPKKANHPSIPLDEDLLRHINLTPGTGNPGLLKNDGRIVWPLALQSDDYRSERELLNSLAPEAIRQAVNGRVDPGTLKDMNTALSKLRDKLTANINDVTPNNYIEASSFLGYFGDAMKILARPDAGDFFSSRFANKGMTVEDLVKYMSDKGVTFAPAVIGDESAYQALHRALVAYDVGSRAQYTAEK